MARVLAIGVATLDIIIRVEHYPLEDEKMRAESRSLQRGGNATNTLVVLSQLGHACTYAGVLSQDAESSHVREDLQRYNIDYGISAEDDSGATPTSYITHNNVNGSRTIVHYRNLREFGFTDFNKVKPDGFDWLHVEGRNIDETIKIMTHVKQVFPGLHLSVEIEKPRPGIESLIEHADTIIFSHSYAGKRGFRDAKTFLEHAAKQYHGKEMVCSWKTQDTAAIGKDGHLVCVPVVPVENVVDTVAAGDTFNAGFIDAKLRGLALQDCVAAANTLAGRKVSQQGLDRLGTAT